jgi:YfiH family protein
MFLRHDADRAVWFTSSIFDNVRSYPQVGDKSVENIWTERGKPLQKVEIRHGFSTKHGGISQLPYISDLNFGFSVGEDRATTVENYRCFARTLGIGENHMLCANQTHTTRVLTVNEAYRGMGLSVPYEQLLDPIIADEGFDGFVTKSPDVALVVRAADCVPILFCDPVNRVIGACHAGWRGTVGGIAAETVDAMCAIGAEKQHIRAAIGHAVGICCYEVDDGFYETFLHTLGENVCAQIFRKSEEYENPDKWHCDLRTCNRMLLENVGLAPEHIDVSEHCTCCHNELFHSHRYAMKYTGGKRGLMAACISMETVK